MRDLITWGWRGRRGRCDGRSDLEHLVRGLSIGGRFRVGGSVRPGGRHSRGEHPTRAQGIRVDVESLWAEVSWTLAADGRLPKGCAQEKVQSEQTKLC